MTDPQQRPPVPSYGQPGFAPVQPPVAPVYQAPPGAYSGPAGGYAVAAPPTPARPLIGRLALGLSLLATVVLSVVGTVLAWQVAAGAGAAITPESVRSGTLGFLTPVRDLVLWLEITAWSATAIGVWALAQGIVATARGLGRGAGIAAIVIAALGPFVFFSAMWIAIIAAGASTVYSRYA